MGGFVQARIESTLVTKCFAFCDSLRIEQNLSGRFCVDNCQPTIPYLTQILQSNTYLCTSFMQCTYLIEDSMVCNSSCNPTQFGGYELDASVSINRCYGVCASRLQSQNLCVKSCQVGEHYLVFQQGYQKCVGSCPVFLLKLTVNCTDTCSDTNNGFFLAG